MSTRTTTQRAQQNARRHERGAGHATLEPEQARAATRGNGVWLVLTVSTALAVTVLLILFGGTLG